jgi:RHS repeat-associated protein
MRRGADRFHVSTDQVGSPRVVTKDDGTVAKVVEYSAFGEVLSDSAPAFLLPVGFGGGIPDATTGLVHLGLRDYDPATGRFTARDPILFGGRQANLYVYAANDPVNQVDPLGLVAGGVTVCEGVCVGGKVAITKDGISICAEIGFGVGEDIEINPTGGLEDSRVYVKGAVEGNLFGLLGAELSTEVSTDGSPCRKVTPKIKGCVFFVCSDQKGDWGLEPDKLVDLNNAAKGVKASLEAKVVSGFCKTW